MFARNDEDMLRGLRVDVAKGDESVVFQHFPGRNAPIGDPTEYAVVHGFGLYYQSPSASLATATATGPAVSVRSTPRPSLAVATPARTRLSRSAAVQPLSGPTQRATPARWSARARGA